MASCMSAPLLHRGQQKERRHYQLIVTFLCGFMFGTIMALGHTDVYSVTRNLMNSGTRCEWETQGFQILDGVIWSRIVIIHATCPRLCLSQHLEWLKIVAAEQHSLKHSLNNEAHQPSDSNSVHGLSSWPTILGRQHPAFDIPSQFISRQKDPSEQNLQTWYIWQHTNIPHQYHVEVWELIIRNGVPLPLYWNYPPPSCDNLLR